MNANDNPQCPECGLRLPVKVVSVKGQAIIKVWCRKCKKEHTFVFIPAK